MTDPGPRTEAPPERPDDRGTPVGRRIVLGMAGLGIVGIAAGKWLSDGVGDVVASTAPGLAGVIPAAGGQPGTIGRRVRCADGPSTAAFSACNRREE